MWKNYDADIQPCDFVSLGRWNSYAGRLNRRLYSRPRRQTRPTTNSQVIPRESTNNPSTEHD